MSSVFPSWEAFYSFITSVKQVLFLVVDDSFFSLPFSLLSHDTTYQSHGRPSCYITRLPLSIICFEFAHLFCLCSADERFDATFHTNVLVNATGSCQYIPPGETLTSAFLNDLPTLKSLSLFLHVMRTFLTFA